jgi:hypothetical protein
VLDTDGNAILADGHHVITIRTSATNYGMPFYFILFFLKEEEFWLSDIWP